MTSPTSFNVCGRYAAEDEPAAAQDPGAEVPPAEPTAARIPVRQVPGHRKDHRPDLNQVKGGLAVSADGRVPLRWEAQDGNRADVSTSVEYWWKVKELVGRSDFLFVGDCQLASQDNLLAIIEHQGRFLAPLPGYAGVQRPLEEWVLTNTVEELIPRREASGQEVWYRGFRRPYALVERETARQIAASGTPLIGLKPNRLPDDRPKTEALMHVFRHVTGTQVILAEHPAEIIMSPLNLLQTCVLQLLGLEESIDTWEYLSRPLHEMDSS